MKDVLHAQKSTNVSQARFQIRSIKFVKLSLNFLLVFTLVFSFTSTWSPRARAEDGSSQANLSGTRKQLATIIFCGLGGAILGLSTLSFYGRPQDYMSNIAIGFAVGIIAGTIVVTVHTAGNLNDLNGANPDSSGMDRFASADRFSSRGFADSRLIAAPSAPTVQLGWQF